MSEAQINRVNSTVMRQCDTLKEGFLNNPRQCTVDFSTLQCQGVSGAACLTPALLETARIFYDGVRNRKGDLIFAGSSISVPMPLPVRIAVNRADGANADPVMNLFLFDTVRILGFQDPDYDWRTFDLDRDMPAIDAAAGLVDAVDPDLRKFKAQGGKLLLYHGWDDPGITAENTISYYSSVMEELGGNQEDWMRLFMAPGMGHCRGGPGPHTFDMISEMEKWREQGEAPERIMGANPQSGLTRPLCPYPQYAKYSGKGDLKDSDNWSCAAP